MRWLGERSYSIYLWNDLARIVTLKALGYTLLGDIVWIAMFVVVAETSFRFVERPLRAKFARRSGVPRTRSTTPLPMRLPQLTHRLPLPARPGADTNPVAVADPPDQLGQLRP
jgi:peptidoglycan/LPS O-acetylase OafA/YrhL